MKSNSTAIENKKGLKGLKELITCLTPFKLYA